MTRLYWHLLCGATLAFGGLALLLGLARFQAGVDIVTLIFFAGAVGAVVNNYYRLAGLAAKPGEVENPEQARLVIIQMYVSLLIGAILAFVAYGIFLGGLIRGSLFPDFDRTDLAYKDLSNLLFTVGPKANIDAAKALLWAFISGFSERLVPNMIDRLIAKSAE
jgi:hypothetical protein